MIHPARIHLHLFDTGARDLILLDIFHAHVHGRIEKRGEKTVSQFLYEAINKELTSDSAPSFSAETLSGIHLNVMKLITLVEELLDDTDSDEISNVLEQLDHLENSFSVGKSRGWAVNRSCLFFSASGGVNLFV